MYLDKVTASSSKLGETEYEKVDDNGDYVSEKSTVVSHPANTTLCFSLLIGSCN